jgi:hypothetical protein
MNDEQDELKTESGAVVTEGEAEVQVIEFKKGCILNSLTAAQQAQLFEWAELYPQKVALEKVAAPPPEGFGIKMHLTTLRRFHLRARLFYGRQLSEEGSRAGADHRRDKPQELTMETVRQAALELSSMHRHGPAEFNAVSRWLMRVKESEHRERELELMKERIELEKRKFEFNAARAAIIHMEELREIMGNPQSDDQDKLQAARERLFGPRGNLIEPKTGI